MTSPTTPSVHYRHGRTAVLGLGYTGQLVARGAVELGADVVTADIRRGRADHIVDARCSAEVTAFLTEQRARNVINCTAPLTNTVLPVASAASAIGVDYLDISGELPSLLRLYQQTSVPTVAVTAGVGFEFCVAELLVERLLDRVGGELLDAEINYHLRNFWPSRGSLRSAVKLLDEMKPRSACVWRRAVPAIRWPGGETVTIRRRHPRANIRTTLAFGRFGQFSWPVAVGWRLLSGLPLARLLDRLPLPAGPPARLRKRARFTISATIRTTKGASTGNVSGKDPYGLTANLGAALTHDCTGRPGLLTPFDIVEANPSARELLGRELRWSASASEEN